MKVTVFGANGKIGRLVVGELLEGGHSVVAFVHHAPDLPKNPRLSIVQGDIADGEVVEAAIKGSGAVVSALGSWGTPTKDILTRGMHTIVPAMRKTSVQRIVSLTGSDAEAPGDKRSLIHGVSRPFLMLAAGKILRDGEQHIRLLADSSLTWTVVRSPVMNDRGKQDYVLNDKRPMPWSTIDRRAVARSLVALLEDNQYGRQAPFIARR